MRGSRLAARLVSRVLLVCGLAALGYAAYVVVATRNDQARERRRFEESRRIEVPVDAPAPLDGDVIGELLIPRLGVAAMVRQGDSVPTLRRAVGHVADTALPGEDGNVVLAGHRDTFFRPLRNVRVGDAIAVRTSAGDFAYVVASTSVVPPGDLTVLQPAGGRTLTLITCYPFSYVGAAPDRFIVRARTAETSAAALP